MNAKRAQTLTLVATSAKRSAAPPSAGSTSPASGSA
jgi:hypothetical protein